MTLVSSLLVDVVVSYKGCALTTRTATQLEGMCSPNVTPSEDVNLSYCVRHFRDASFSQ